MAELKKYLDERGLREVWDILNGQNSKIVAAIKNLQGRTTANVFVNTTAGWGQANPQVTIANAVYIYTDAPVTDVDKAARVKIGDGATSLAKLSFADEVFAAHINNTSIHVTNAEREKWNNKVSASITDEQLVLNNE